MAGFVQGVERLVRAEYRLYVRGCIPDHADPGQVDAAIAAKYQTRLSRSAKYRRYHPGRIGRNAPRQAKIAYLRYGPEFVILATRGSSPFFEHERPVNIGRRALRIFGYCIGWKNGHVKVEIDGEQFAVLTEVFRENAVRLPVERIEQAFRALDFCPYYGVKRQYFRLLKVVNQERAEWGLAAVSPRCLPLAFRRVKVSA